MRRHQPALLGGLFIGVLSSLPIVNAANICCCLWVVSGGLLTTYLLQQSHPEPVEGSEAALEGLIAGFIGGALASIVALTLFTAAGSAIQDQLRTQLEQNSQIPSEMRDRMLVFLTGRNLALVQVLVTLPTYAVFGLLGGLLGLPLFRKKPPAVPQDGSPSV